VIVHAHSRVQKAGARAALVALSSGMLVPTFVAGFCAAADRLRLTPLELLPIAAALLVGALVGSAQRSLSPAGTMLSCLVGSISICLVQFAPAWDALAAFCCVIGTAAAPVYAQIRHAARRHPHGSFSWSLWWASAIGVVAGAAAIVLASLPAGQAAVGLWASAAPAVTLLGLAGTIVLAVVATGLPALRRAKRRRTASLRVRAATAVLLAVLLLVPTRRRVPRVAGDPS
jgi:hypothetical protein